MSEFPPEILPKLLRGNATWLRDGNDPEWYGSIPEQMESAADALGLATAKIEKLVESRCAWRERCVERGDRIINLEAVLENSCTCAQFGPMTTCPACKALETAGDSAP